MMNKIIFFFAFLITLLIGTASLKAQYVPQNKNIVAHQTIKLTLPDTDKLTIVYRPGSNISDSLTVPVNGTTYQWTPREAGIVSLVTPNGPVQTVSVRFNDYPFWGYFIMFGAAFILFGGAIFASTKLFS